jgi:hypothetical protein
VTRLATRILNISSSSRQKTRHSTSPYSNLVQMTQYVPPTSQPPPPGASRSRASSSASAKYTPDHYNTKAPPPPITAPVPIPPQVRPRGPSFAGQTIGATPPKANTGYYGSSPGYFGTSPLAHGQLGTSPGFQGYAGTPQGYIGTPQAPPYPRQGYGGTPQGPPYPPAQLHSGYPGAQTWQPAPHPADVTDSSGRMRPPPDQRRASVSSTHSRHSTHSKHSKRSRHSRQGSHHSSRRHSEDEYGSDRDGRRRSNDRDLKPIKRTSTHRPSWGDTIYGMLGVIKDALGPRDKY